MRNSITIRAGLTLIIGIFVAFLIAVIAVGYGGLRLANHGLSEMQHSSAALLKLKTSSEKVLKVRLDLASYETLFSVGKETDELLSSAHKVLLESNADFGAYMNSSLNTAQEHRLAGAAAQARKALVDDAIEVEFKALRDNDFTTFRKIQSETANELYATYSKAISGLETYQATNEQAQADLAASRFNFASRLFMAVGAVAVVVAMGARLLLTAALLKPLKCTGEHFDLIASGDITSEVTSGSRNEMGQLLNALERMRIGLAEAVGKVRNSAEAINVGISEIASGNIDLSRRTEQQAAALEETAATMDQLSATVKQNADNAKQASGLALHASETVTLGGTVVGRVIETMDGISDSSRRSSDLII